MPGKMLDVCQLSYALYFLQKGKIKIKLMQGPRQKINFVEWSILSEIHEQRVKGLRDLEKQIAEDNWKYTPIEKILGLQ